MKVKNIETLRALCGSYEVQGYFDLEALSHAEPKVAKNAEPFVHNLCRISVKDLKRGTRVSCKIPKGRSYDFKSHEGITVLFLDNISVSVVLEGSSDFNIEDGVISTRIPDNLNILHIMVLDMSTSMGWAPSEPFWKGPSRYKLMIPVLDRKMKSLREADAAVTNVTTYISSMYFNQNVGAVSPKEDVQSSELENNYRLKTPLGGTALNDAIHKAVERATESLDEMDKVVVEIFTDGEDEHSYRSVREVNEIIRKVNDRHEGKITLAIAGMGPEFPDYAKRLSIPETNILHIQSSEDGMKEYAQTTSFASMSYTRKASKGQDVTSDYFSFDEE